MKKFWFKHDRNLSKTNDQNPIFYKAKFLKKGSLKRHDPTNQNYKDDFSKTQEYCKVGNFGKEFIFVNSNLKIEL